MGIQEKGDLLLSSSPPSLSYHAFLETGQQTATNITTMLPTPTLKKNLAPEGWAEKEQFNMTSRFICQLPPTLYKFMLQRCRKMLAAFLK